MTQPTRTNTENEALGAFAGLIILIVFLSILFMVTTPGVLGSDEVADTNNNAEVVAVEETEIVETVAEAATEATEEPVVLEEPTDEPTTTDNAGDSADTYDPALVAQGEILFTTCAACHGPDGRGIAGLGKDLVEGEFVNSASDEEIMMVIANGRPIWDVANTTMVDMPVKGGNPLLTDDDIHAIVAYIRSLQTP